MVNYTEYRQGISRVKQLRQQLELMQVPEPNIDEYNRIHSPKRQ